MTPKEKAQELVDKFLPHVRWKMAQEDVKERAKQCALIAVDEVLEETMERDGMRIVNNQYWFQVKLEIEKL